MKNFYIKTIQDILNSNNNVEFGYVFGSLLNDRFTRISDIDIAVWLKNDSISYQLRLHHQLERNLKRDVDMVVLSRIKSITLLNDIFKFGRVVCSRNDEELITFELMVEHKIKDYKSFKRYLYAG
jgi:predicted nucleotidyltransferase